MYTFDTYVQMRRVGPALDRLAEGLVALGASPERFFSLAFLEGVTVEAAVAMSVPQQPGTPPNTIATLQQVQAGLKTLAAQRLGSSLGLPQMDQLLTQANQTVTQLAQAAAKQAPKPAPAPAGTMPTAAQPYPASQPAA
jgi:hypothetical protein